MGINSVRNETDEWVLTCYSKCKLAEVSCEEGSFVRVGQIRTLKAFRCQHSEILFGRLFQAPRTAMFHIAA